MFETATLQNTSEQQLSLLKAFTEVPSKSYTGFKSKKRQD